MLDCAIIEMRVLYVISVNQRAPRVFIYNCNILYGIDWIRRYSQYSSLHYRAWMDRGQTANDLNFYSPRIICLLLVLVSPPRVAILLLGVGSQLPANTPRKRTVFKFRTFSAAIFYDGQRSTQDHIRNYKKLGESKTGTRDKAYLRNYVGTYETLSKL